MDLTNLSTLILEKIKDANAYSELSDQELFEVIYDYLDAIYKKQFLLAQRRIENAELKGIFPNSEKYKKEYDNVEDIVMTYANKLSAMTKDEL